jgi:zinc finger-containing ubiquitin peptidase 1
MPSWLRKTLENTKVTRLNHIGLNGLIVTREIVENEATHIIPVLAQLCNQDSSVRRALFCSPEVRHVFKLPREGGFCGYRNIQMLISHIKDARRPGHEHFPGRLPSILGLQDMIEQAWDTGFNSTGRIETGGIKGTRKYIGTPEVRGDLCTFVVIWLNISQAQALFLSLGIK